MPKFKFSEIGPAGVTFLRASGSRNNRYFGADEALVSYTGSSHGEELQHIDANGFEYKGQFYTLYTFDPDLYEGATLRAALEDYAVAREAAIAARRARRRG